MLGKGIISEVLGKGVVPEVQGTLTHYALQAIRGKAVFT